MTYQKVYIKNGKEQFLSRFHPWIFSGAIERVDAGIADGDVVWVADKKGKILATGHYHQGNIAVRLLAFEQVVVDTPFWLQRLKIAYNLRQKLGLIDNANTNAYRLVNGEGDGFSGLIVDFYNGTAVLQAHSIGMHRARKSITEALIQLYDNKQLIAVYDKSKASLPVEYAAEITDDYLWGQVSDNEQTVSENGYLFRINWATGQKTGFFLDQRDNRALLGQYAKGRAVLNAFSYSGGFSVYALANGATRVDSVDVSEKAMQLLDNNIKINNLQNDFFGNYTQDVLTYLKQTEQLYDVVILDPPAYAKSIAKRHNAVQGYKRLNVEGLKKVQKGGFLFTFSCSQVVDRQLFYDTIMAAAIESGRVVRVLHHLSQPPDHPVNIFHPEGHYLKGLVLAVD